MTEHERRVADMELGRADKGEGYAAKSPSRRAVPIVNKVITNEENTCRFVPVNLGVHDRL
jgi:hypothetical protein